MKILLTFWIQSHLQTLMCEYVYVELINHSLQFFIIFLPFIELFYYFLTYENIFLTLFIKFKKNI